MPSANVQRAGDSTNIAEQPLESPNQSRKPVPPWIPLIGAGSVLGLFAVMWLAWTSVTRPQDHWPEVKAGRAYLAQRRPDLALRAVSNIRDRAPGAAEGLTVAAQAFLEFGAVSDAKRALTVSLNDNPTQPDALKILAAIYLASGDGTRGLELLKKAASLEPGDFRPLLAMGKVYHDMGDLAAAADAYTRALERNPPTSERTEAHIGRARMLMESGRTDAAASDIEALKVTAPNDPTVLALSARFARDQDRPAEALPLAERAITLDAAHFDARLVRGQIRAAQGDAEGALDDLEHASRINPNHVGALQLLLQAQSRLGRAEAADATRALVEASRKRTELMDRLTKEIYNKPTDPEPRVRMGHAALEGKMTTLAYQCFQAALDLDPNYAPAREALAAMAPQSLPGARAVANDRPAGRAR